MKKILYIVFLFSVAAQSQYAEPDGQILFSNAQWDIIVARINGTASTPNVMNDAGFLVSEANAFMASPGTDRYDYMDASTPFSTSSLDRYYPTPVNSVNPSDIASDNIHCAAIVAAATSNQSMATNVLDQIYIQATDDKLDFGNGAGANNPNATYGTTARFQVIAQQVGSPNFLIVEKIIKHIYSYTLLKDKGLISLTTAEENRLNGWFYDAYVYYKGLLDLTVSASWGSDWRNRNFTLLPSQNRLYPDGSSFANPFIANSAGVRDDDFTSNELQRYGLVNTRMGYAHYAGLYALLYNDQAGIDYIDDYYEMVFEMAVYPDGSHLELDRSTETIPDQGINNYVWVNIQGLSLMALSHKIAKVNGLPSMATRDGNKLFELTTDKGWEDYPSASGMAVGTSPTGGSPKNLKKLIDASLKYVQQNYGSNYGWSPTRHVTRTPFGMIGSHANNKRPYINVLSVVNMYYDDPVYQGIIEQDPIYEMHTPVMKTGSGLNNLGSWQHNQSFWGALLTVDTPYAGMRGILSGVTERTKALRRSYSKSIFD